MNFVLSTSKCSMCDGKCIPVQLVINKCFYSRIITGGNTEFQGICLNPWTFKVTLYPIYFLDSLESDGKYVCKGSQRCFEEEFFERKWNLQCWHQHVVGSHLSILFQVFSFALLNFSFSKPKQMLVPRRALLHWLSIPSEKGLMRLVALHVCVEAWRPPIHSHS